MAEFRTPVVIEPSLRKIDHQHRILLMGSCFTDSIGRKLQEYLFPVKINPFGVLYNPLSIMNGLGILADKTDYQENEIGYFNDLWFSWDHHSSFSHPEKEHCLERINKELRNSSGFLSQAEILMITFGTSWIFRLKSNGQVVANCHKHPEKLFDRIFLNPEDIVRSWSEFIPELLKINPELRIIFTVSPVRHLKDGAHGNQLSKASLLLSVNRLCRLFPENLEYFPAFEILLDDLRDYRFYAPDMLHPNDTAITYVQKIFAECYFDTETRNINRELESLAEAWNHRFFNPDAPASIRFRKKTNERVDMLRKKYPYLPIRDIF